MRSLLLLSLVLAGAFVGSHAQLTTPSDVALEIKPDETTGESQIGFHVYGPKGGEFFFRNDNNGTLELSSNMPVLTIKTAAAAAEAEEPAAEAAFLEQGAFVGSKVDALIEGVHSARQHLLKARAKSHVRGSARRLLAEAAAAATKNYVLAESITAGKSISVTGNIASTFSGDVLVNDVKQWKMILHDDMQGTVSDWSNSGAQFPLPADNGVSICATSTHAYSDYFLGNYGKMEAKKTFKLPPHSRLRIKARVHFIDKWGGESVYTKVDGSAVWSESHHWCNEATVIACIAKEEGMGGMKLNVCGHKMYPDRLSVPVDVVLAHTKDSLELVFGSDVEEKDASWGVDDVQLYIM